MFEDRLTKIREEHGLNKKEAALALNMPYSTYLSYENNEREPNSETLIQIAKYFDVSIDYLLGISKVKTVDENVKNACRVTGLTENAIKSLQNFCLLEPFGKIYLNDLIEELALDGKNEKATLFKIILYLHYKQCPSMEKDLVLFANNTVELVGNKHSNLPHEVKRIPDKEIVPHILLDDVIDNLKNM